MSSVLRESRPTMHVFHVGCWVLGLIAFLELVAVGVALGLERQKAVRPTVIERIEYVPMNLGPGPRDVMPTPEPAPAALAKVEVPPYTPPPPVEMPKAKPLHTPPIADPVVERLVLEAQEARVGDDLQLAMVKLEEASQRTPDDPNVLYQFAQVYEAYGVYDKAENYYQKVYELGSLKSGNLYQLSGHKLSHGFLLAERMHGKLALGRVRQFFDKRVESGERIILTVPVLAAPNQQIDPDLIGVTVRFYDKLQEEVIPAADRNKPQTEWITLPADWLDPTGEELLQVTYYIPEGDMQEQHLFGQRKYYGQLVELSYQGELVDSQASPRTLARKVNAPNQDPLFLPEEFLPPDLNPDNPLLPPLPHR